MCFCTGTVFAYGQTASGKTYTMVGSEQVPGIIPLAINGIFNMIESVSFNQKVVISCILVLLD